MKKIMFLALPALMLASCSSDDVVNEARAGIQYAPALNRGGRAAETTTINIPEFNVTAYGDGKLYFQDVNIQSNGGLWDSEYLWPNYDLGFVAYYPTSLNGSVEVKTDGKASIKDVTIEQKLVDQQDIVVARNVGTKAGEKVTLVFDHILSNIEIKAKVVNENLKYEIMGVKLCNFNSKGTFTYPAAAAATSDKLAAFDNTRWTALSDLASYITKGDKDAPVLLDKTGEVKSLMNDADGSFMPISQTVTGWNLAYDTTNNGAYVSILCRISQNDNAGNFTQIFPKTADKYGFAALPISYAFQPGKKYTLVLELDGGGYRDPNDVDPEDPDPDPTDPDNPIDPTPDPDDPDDPDPILPGKISYQVIVNDWDAADDIVLSYTHPDEENND